MASFSVQYIFDFVVKNLGSLSGVGPTAQKMAGAVNAAGAAANGMAAALEKSGAAGSAAAAGYRAATSAAREYAAAANSAAKSAASGAAGRGGPMVFAGGMRYEAKEAARLDRLQNNMIARAEAKAEMKRMGLEGSGGGATVIGAGGRLMNAWAGIELARMGLHGIDKTVQHVADLDTQRRKLALALGSTPEAYADADAAVVKAKQLAARYTNTTAAENMKILDDLRANYPEGIHELTNEMLEPFVKLHSFFKSYKGGKHAGEAEKSLQDINTAIRSGELGGNVTAKQAAEWAEQLSVMRVVYGDKLKIDEFFKAQKAARYSLPGTSDRFKTSVFPAMVQAMGIGAGVASATTFNKMIGGITVHQSTAEFWRELGLVNMDQVRLKKGKIDPSSLAGKNWVKGGDLYATDPDYFMTDVLLPALARSGKVTGLTPEVATSLAKSYHALDAMGVGRELQKFVKEPSFVQALAPLGKDRNAVQQFFLGMERLASFAKDQDQVDRVRRGGISFDNYDTAKQSVSAQWDALLNSMFGKDSMGVMISGLHGLAGALRALSDTVTRAKNGPLGAFFPKEPGGLLGGGINGTDAAAFGAVRRLFGAGGRQSDFNLALDIMRMREAGGGLDTFANSMPVSLDAAQTAMRRSQEAARTWSIHQQMMRGQPDEAAPGWFDRMFPNWGGPRDIHDWSQPATRAFDVPQTAQASMVPQAVTVTTDVKTEVQGSVTVNITGQVNAPINQTATAPISGAGRGTAQSSVGGPATP